MSTDLAVSAEKDVTVSVTPALKSSPELNRKLLRHARKSYKDIEAITGIPAEEVAERLTALIHDRTLRDELTEERLILLEVGQMVGDLKDELESMRGGDNYAKMATVLLQSLKLLFERLDARRKMNTDDLTKLNDAQAKLMVAAINMATERTLQRLASQTGIDIADVNDMFKDDMRDAAKLLQDRVVD